MKLTTGRNARRRRRRENIVVLAFCIYLQVYFFFDQFESVFFIWRQMKALFFSHFVTLSLLMSISANGLATYNSPGWRVTNGQSHMTDVHSKRELLFGFKLCQIREREREGTMSEQGTVPTPQTNLWYTNRNIASKPSFYCVFRF